MLNKKRRIGRVSRLVLITFTAAALALPAALSAGNYTKSIGNSKFGAYLSLDYNLAAKKESVKSFIDINPEIGAKIFSRNIGILGAEFLIGNYGSYRWQNVVPNMNKVQDWSAYAGVYLFGRTVYSKTRNLSRVCTLKEEAVVKNGKYTCKTPENKKAKNPNAFQRANSWFKKHMPRLRYPVGPVVIYVDSGVTLGYNLTPEIKPIFKKGSGLSIAELGVEAAIKPGLSAKAFVEGGVSAWVLKGGIGANLTLFSGSAGLAGKVAYANSAIKANIDSVFQIGVLSGKVYAFVDRIKIKCCFKKRWKRWLNFTIASWRGYSWRWQYTLWRKSWAL